MLKSTSHRSIQHAKITKKPQYKNQIERKTNLLRNNIIDNS